jgi:ribosome biogenesis GTPase
VYRGTQALTLAQAGSVQGVVAGTGGGRYRIRLGDGRVVEAAFRGRLKQEGRSGGKVVIGDRVTVALSDDHWVVDSVGERSTVMMRRGVGGAKPRVVAANLDRVLVVISAGAPHASLELVDRLLAVVESSGLRPALVVNKVDLEGGPEVAASLTGIYGPIGYRVFCVSAHAKIGLDSLDEEMCLGTCALIGPSGAGKSSLLNALHPELDLRVGVLSRKTSRGRHTTVDSRLLPLACGGFVADTPGFGEVGLWGVAPEEVEACFSEIEALASQCRFRGCAHIEEPDCAVREAVESGKIAESRYRSYAKLRAESSEAEE